MSEWLTVAEAAVRLRISVRSTWTLIRSGRLRTVHPVPGRTLLAVKEVEAFMASVERRNVA